MNKIFTYPLVVIGAGAGGLVVAIGAVKAGKKVLLIEKGTYGGDCTNFGCIPSKSLIASAHCAHAIKTSKTYGIELNGPSFLATQALSRTRNIVESVRSHEDPKALQTLGVDTLTGTASFLDPYTLEVITSNDEKKTVKAKKIVIATGSRPRLPNIKGLDTVSYLTNETIFDLKDIPKKLGIIGGGPIGCELAQAFSRLGSDVTIIQRNPHLLENDENEAELLLEKRFENEGISVHLNSEPKAVRKEGDDLIVTLINDQKLTFSHLLVAAGRVPNNDTLNLDKIDVKTNKRGIVVNDYGQTTQKHIFAVGDAAGRALYTHLAENEARGVLTNLLLPWPFRFKLDKKQSIPHVTYTDPEIASAGLKEKDAIQKYGETKIKVYTLPLTNVDRAITDGQTDGFVKIITKKWSSQIVGVTIAGPRAGELLCEVTLAMQHKIPLRKLTSLIHPYPTYSRAIRKTADKWLTENILPILKKFII